MAKDPRPLIVHEGVPGHYLQLALCWAQPDIIRRHYYDSSANEGLGFYAEEMTLDAGLFDDSPSAREIIWNFMRLRALRVEVDVKLALGEVRHRASGGLLAPDGSDGCGNGTRGGILLRIESGPGYFLSDRKNSDLRFSRQRPASARRGIQPAGVPRFPVAKRGTCRSYCSAGSI
jgi:hypothetical protein